MQPERLIVAIWTTLDDSSSRASAAKQCRNFNKMTFIIAASLSQYIERRGKISPPDRRVRIHQVYRTPVKSSADIYYYEQNSALEGRTESLSVPENLAAPRRNSNFRRLQRGGEISARRGRNCIPKSSSRERRSHPARQSEFPH